MKQYGVYQIEVTKAMRDLVNANGWAALDEFIELMPMKAKQDLTFDGAEAYKPEMKSYFRLLGVVQANTLDEVFRLTNLWDDPDKVTRYPGMHSTSVGDIIFDGTSWFMVDNFGFKEIE